MTISHTTQPYLPGLFVPGVAGILSVCLSDCLSVCLTVCLSVCLYNGGSGGPNIVQCTDQLSGGWKARLIDLPIPIRSFRLYWPIQSTDFKFRFLYQPTDSIGLFYVPILKSTNLSSSLKHRFLFWAIVSVCFKLRLFNRPILFWFQVPTFVSTDCDGQYLGIQHKQKRMSFILSWRIKKVSEKLFL